MCDIMIIFLVSFLSRFSKNYSYRVGWSPYKGYSAAAVAADYGGSVTVENTAISDYCAIHAVTADYC